MSESLPIELVLKLETNGVIATRVIVVTLLDVNTGAMQSFSDRPGAPPIQQAVDLLPLADLIIVQTPYALRALHDLYGLTIDPARILDTYGAACRLRASEKHGIDAWAARLGVSRNRFLGAPQWSDEAQRHCENDARLVAKIYHTLYEEVEV